MSTKGIVLKRNTGDQAKYDQLRALNPAKLFTYQSAAELATLKCDFGNLDYLLITGGHGDFQNRKPSKFNDADIASVNTWLKGISGQFKAVILDTCFSSAIIGSFLGFVPNGGSVVCAHGTGEGWAVGFTAADGAKTVGTVLAGVITGSSAIFGTDSYSSISLAVKKPTNQLLWTANAGAMRGKGIATRQNFGMEVDTEIELKDVDMYLARDRINVTAVSDDELAKMLTENLKMTVV